MRGQWLINVFLRVLDRSISLSDAIQYTHARIRSVPLSYKLGSVKFSNVDRTVWSVCSEVILGKCYNPRGFQIKPNDTVVDIGAHRGVFVAYAASAASHVVHAYEPVAENYSELNRLIQENGWTNVRTHNYAVSSNSGKIALFRSGSHTRHTVLDTDVVSGEPLFAAEEVMSVTLEEVVEPLDKIDFLKMDCEGSEFSILLGASLETFKKIEKLALEYHAERESELMKLLITRLKTQYSHVIIRPGTHPGLGFIYAGR